MESSHGSNNGKYSVEGSCYAIRQHCLRQSLNTDIFLFYAKKTGGGPCWSNGWSCTDNYCNRFLGGTCGSGYRSKLGKHICPCTRQNKLLPPYEPYKDWKKNRYRRRPKNTPRKRPKYNPNMKSPGKAYQTCVRIAKRLCRACTYIPPLGPKGLIAKGACYVFACGAHAACTAKAGSFRPLVVSSNSKTSCVRARSMAKEITMRSSSPDHLERARTLVRRSCRGTQSGKRRNAAARRRAAREARRAAARRRAQAKYLD